MSDATFEAEAPKKKSKWGCILGGCLGVIVLGIIITAVGGYLGYRAIAGQIEKYTSDTPRELPVVEYTDEQMQVLKDQLAQIQSAAENGEVAEPMVLTADDINALIAQEPTFKERVSVSIEDGQVTADMSFPLDQLPLPGGKGRFFNGSVTADVAMANGMLDVRIADAVVNGENLPAEVLQGIRAENLAKEANKDPKFQDAIKHFDNIEIVGDKLILTPAGSGNLMESSEAIAEPISP